MPGPCLQELRAQLALCERELRTMRQQRNALLAGLRRSGPKGGMQGCQRGDLQGDVRETLQGDPWEDLQRGRGMRQQRGCGEASTDSSRGSSRERSPEGDRMCSARAAAAAEGAASPPGHQASPRGDTCGAANANGAQQRCTGDRAPDASCCIRMCPPAAGKALSEAQLGARAAPGGPAAPREGPRPDHQLGAQAMDAACAASESLPHSATLSSLSDCPGTCARTPAALLAHPTCGTDPYPSSSGRWARASPPAVCPAHPGPGASGRARTPEPATWDELLGSPGARSASAPLDGGQAEPWGCKAGPLHRSRLSRAPKRAAAGAGGNALHSAMGDAGDVGLPTAVESMQRHGEAAGWSQGQEGGAWVSQEGFGEPLHDPQLLARLANLKLVTDELLLEALL